MKTIEKMEQDLLIKKQRVSYWEQFGSLPTNRELVLFSRTNWRLTK